MSPLKIKPCPCCGKEYPYTYISSSCVVIECVCGMSVKNGAARILYPRSDVPAELVPYQYEITPPDPKVDYVAINALAALDHAGILSIWNQRVGETLP